MTESRAGCLAFAGRLGFLRFDVKELLEIAERAERFFAFLHRLGQRDQGRGLRLRLVLRPGVRAVGLSRTAGALKRPTLRRLVPWRAGRRGSGS